MALWRITIEGSGAQHTGGEHDADACATRFIELLHAYQHTVRRANFELINHDGRAVAPAESLLAEKTDGTA